MKIRWGWKEEKIGFELIGWRKKDIERMGNNGKILKEIKM